MDPRIVLLICVGGAVMLLAYWGISLFMRRDQRLRERLIADEAGVSSPGRVEFVPLLQRVGSAAAQPFMPRDRESQSALRSELARAGIYGASAPRLVTGGKVLGMVFGVAAGYFVGDLLGNLPMGMSVGGLVGYVIPRIVLRFRIASHQKALTQGLPDALDLMVICVEAGLTLDSAMQRVGHELAIAHPRISREIGIAHMETRVGLSRAESLRNLGSRTGNAALQSLAAMLIQAERFGTSIATALRIHADSLRSERQHAAEESAAKASVKLSFPLVMFILPATFIILAGPFVIALFQSDLFK